MSPLKLLFYVLQFLTTVTGLNIFSFDENRRVFKRRRIQYLIMRRIYKLLILPVLLLTIGCLAVCVYSFQRFMMSNGNTTEMLFDIQLFIMASLPLMKFGPVVYIAFIYIFHTDDMELLLNSFVNVHDKNVKFFAAPVKINWVFTLLAFTKIVGFDGLVWGVSQISKDGKKSVVVAGIISVPSILLSVVCIFGAILLHAYSSNLHFQALRTERKLKISNLLKLHESLRKLVQASERFISLVVLMELFICISGVTLSIHTYLGDKQFFKMEMLVCFLSIVYPFVLTNISDDIVKIQHKFPQDLLYSKHNHSKESDYLLQMYCFLNLLFPNPSNKFGKVLHLRKSFFLWMVSCGYINGMFMNSLYMSKPGFYLKQLLKRGTEEN